LAKKCCESVVKDRVRYAKKYKDCLLKRDFSELNSFSDSKRNHVLKALSSLAKFLGMYQDFKASMKNCGLTWKTMTTEDLIISRLAGANKSDDIIWWISKIKKRIPELSVFMDFVLISGLRLNESIRAYNLVIHLAKEGKLNEYYDVEAEALEHFRFKHLFIRRTKKVFISFIPKVFIDRISKQENLTRYQIDNRIRRDNKLKSRFSDIREYYATYMTKWLTQPEIDFLQGRVSANVFMRNYFNPALISDLKERAFRGINEVLGRIWAEEKRHATRKEIMGLE
jgi:intergrase/recombinase